MSNLLGMDSETLLIWPGNNAPAPVCFTAAGATTRARLIHGQKETLPGNDTRTQLKRSLDNMHTTWANGPFDWGVMCEHYGLWEEVFDALDNGRMHDVQSREKLLDIARGRFRWHEDEETGDKYPVGYSLNQIARRYGFKGKMFDRWQLNYYRLIDKPLAQWPIEPKQYACVDAYLTRQIHLLQDQEVERDTWGHLAPSLAVEADAVRGHWALHLITSWGFPTDPAAVKALRDRCVREHSELFPKLVDSGLVREDGTRDTNAAKARVLEAYGELECPITATGQERMRGIEKDGTRTTPWPRERAIKAGYISCSKDVCWNTEDDVLHNYARFSQLSNLLSKDVPQLERGTILPVQAGYQPIMETFRTSSVGFNIQNLRREPGVRECFRARKGHVIVAADFDTAELVSLAQVTYTLFGFSRMRDAILAGEDLHLKVAANLRGIPYAEAVEQRKAGDETIKSLRQLAKACYHPDTEVLTPLGWKQIGRLEKGEKVAAAIPQEGGGVRLEWQTPTDVFRQKNPHDHLVHYKNEGIDIRVTPDHRMLYWNTGKNPCVRQACDFTGNERTWANAGDLDGFLDEDHDLLRLVVATQADGSFNGKQIRFGFSKKRKIDRLCALLDRLEAEYKVAWYTNGESEKLTTCITVRPGALLDRVKGWLIDKKLTWMMLDLKKECREIIVDESRHWDGCRQSNWRAHQYYSSDKHNVDVMQALAASVGCKTRVAEREGPTYTLTIRHKHDTRGGATKRTEIPYDGTVVCLTVPSSFVLVRDGGVPLVCGNCNFGLPGGMGAKSFAAYARGYLRGTDIVVTPQEAVRLKKLWMTWWPEMAHYFEWVRQQQDEDSGLYYAQHPVTKRCRGGMFYTSCANNSFQELTAFGAKAAAYAVARAQHIEPRSPLYGTKTLAFVHDELLLEMREDEYLTKRCRELVRVMCKAYNRYTPDVPVSAEATAMRVWSKKATARYDAAGNIIVWEPERKAA